MPYVPVVRSAKCLNWSILTRAHAPRQVMSGIRIIKLMAWEASFAGQIKEIRDEELKQVRKSAVYRGMYYTVAMSVPIIIITVRRRPHTTQWNLHHNKHDHF